MDEGGRERGGAGGGLIGRVVLVRRGEGVALAGSAVFFFLVLGGYGLLRPVREAMGIARSWDDLPWLMTGTMAAVLAVNPAFSWMAARWARRRFVPWTYRAFALSMLAFAGLLAGAGEHRLWVGYGFYIWLSVLNLLAVSVFWSVMADVFSREQGERLFAFIGAGGTLGAIAGPAAAKWLTGEGVRAEGLLVIAAAALEGAAWCGWSLVRGGAGRRATEEPGPGVWTGMTLVARSPYLLMICAYLFLYSLMSTLLYMEQGRIVSGAALGEGERVRVFATIDVWANVVTLVMQVLIAGRFIRWLGVGAALAVVPALTAFGFAALWAAPGLGWPALTVLIVFQIGRRGVQHALGSPARQVLFTVVSADAKYKSKAFIETFVYRGGDLAGAWSPKHIVRGLAQLGIGAAAAVPVVAVPLGILGVGVAVLLGGMFRGRAAAQQQPDEGSPPVAPG